MGMETLTEAFQTNLDTDGFGERYLCLIEKENREISITYHQLYRKALSYLYDLQMKGIGPGDELVLLMEDNEPFIYIFWACILGGIIPVPVSASSNREHRLKLLNIWRVLRKPTLVTTRKWLNSLAELDDGDQVDGGGLIQNIKDRAILLEDIQVSAPGTIYASKPGDIAFIQFSSGSTGEPKGVVLTHKNLLTNIKATIQGTKLQTDDQILSWMPLTHDMGLIGFHLGPLVAGRNQIVIHTSLFIRRPLLWMDKVSEHQATILSSPNFGFQYFLSFLKPQTTMNWDLSRVRLIFNGAEPISSEVSHKFLFELKKYQLPENVIFPVYGMAEASLAVTFPPPGERFITYKLSRDHWGVGDKVIDVAGDDLPGVTFVDLGFPVDKCAVRIGDGSSNILEEDRIGLIQIKGENVTSGYYNNPNANQEVFLEEGWFNTGDLGFIRNRRLIVTGRVKDIIFIHGQNYYAHDLERVAGEVEGVEPGTVTACGISDRKEQREEIILFVLSKKKLDKFAPLALNLKKHIFKCMGLEITQVIPVNKIPKTTSGKVMRFRLQERYSQGEFTAVIEELHHILAQNDGPQIMAIPATSIEARLVSIWSELLGNQIQIHDNFLEVGGNSLFLANFCAKIEQENLGRVVTPIDLFSYPSIKKLAQFLEGKEVGRHETVNFLQLKFPTEYLSSTSAASVVFNKDPLLCYKIQNPLFEELERICQSENVTTDDILIALFGYLLYEITEQAEITLQTMTRSMNRAEMLTINFQELNEISELFQMVHHKQNSNQNYTYSLSGLNHLSAVGRDPSFIVPFCYHERKLTVEVDLLEIYDLCLGFMKVDGSIQLTFDYNNQRLNQVKMKELAGLYAGLIGSIIDQYQAEKVNTHEEKSDNH